MVLCSDCIFEIVWNDYLSFSVENVPFRKSSVSFEALLICHVLVNSIIGSVEADLIELLLLQCGEDDVSMRTVMPVEGRACWYSDKRLLEV